MSKISRLPKWESLLDSFLFSNLNRPFQWGEWDCGIFSSSSLQVISGEDFLSSLRSEYSPQWAQENSSNLLSLLSPIINSFELQACGVNFIRRGDLVLIQNSPSPCLGILSLDSRGVMVGEKGLIFVGREKILQGWHV